MQLTIYIDKYHRLTRSCSSGPEPYHRRTLFTLSLFFAPSPEARVDTSIPSELAAAMHPPPPSRHGRPPAPPLPTAAFFLPPPVEEARLTALPSPSRPPVPQTFTGVDWTAAGVLLCPILEEACRSADRRTPPPPPLPPGRSTGLGPGLSLTPKQHPAPFDVQLTHLPPCTGPLHFTCVLFGGLHRGERGGGGRCSGG